MIKSNGMEPINDEQLEKVNGGMYWKAFGLSVYKQLEELGSIESQYIQMIDAIKAKDWMLVAELAQPMIYEKDPVCMKAFSEVKE